MICLYVARERGVAGGAGGAAREGATGGGDAEGRGAVVGRQEEEGARGAGPEHHREARGRQGRVRGGRGRRRSAGPVEDGNLGEWASDLVVIE